MALDSPSRIEAPGRHRALFRLFIGSTIISTAPVFIKLAEVGPDAAGFWRMLFASLALALWLIGGKSSFRIPVRAAGWAAFGGMALGLDFMCWHRSIELIGPGLSTLLGNFQIFFTALFSWLFFQERITRMFLGAVLMTVFGLACMTGLNLSHISKDTLLGLSLGLATALFYSILILALKRAVTCPGTGHKAAMFWITTTCTLFMAFVTQFNEASFQIPNTKSLLSLLGAGVLCSTIAWAMISKSLRMLPATLTGLILLLQPALAMVWDVILFSRPTDLADLFGVCLILSGIFLGSSQGAHRTSR